MIAFIILRILDVWSTLLSVSTFGADLEANQWSRFLLENHLFVLFQVFATIVICALLVKFNNRAVRIGLGIFNLATTIVVASNFISYFIAKGAL